MHLKNRSRAENIDGYPLPRFPQFSRIGRLSFLADFEARLGVDFADYCDRTDRSACVTKTTSNHGTLSV